MNSIHAMLILLLFGFTIVYMGFYFQHRDNVDKAKVGQLKWSTPEQILEAMDEN